MNRSCFYFVALSLCFLAGCIDPSESLSFYGDNRENLSVNLIKLSPEAVVSEKTVYESRSAEGFMELIDRGRVLHTADGIKILLDVGLYSLEDDNIIRWESSSYPMVDADDYPFIQGYWPDSFGENNPMVIDGDLWRVSGDWRLFSQIGENMETIREMDNPYCDRKDESLFDVVSADGYFYLLHYSRFSGFFIRVTDRDFNMKRFSDLGQIEPLGTLLPWDENAKLYTLSDISYDGENYDYSLKEIDFSPEENSEVYIDPTALGDLLRYTPKVYYRDGLTLLWNSKGFFSHDTTSERFIFRAYECPENYGKANIKAFLGIDNLNRIVLLEPKVVNPASGYCEITGVTATWFDDTFNVLREESLDFSGESNRRLLCCDIDSEGNVFVIYSFHSS